MKVLTPFTIVWVVRKRANLKEFLGPLYVDSVEVKSSYNFSVDYHLKSAHNSYTPSQDQSASSSDVYTSMEEALTRFHELNFGDLKTINDCISERSRNSKEQIDKANKEDQEEERSSSPKRDLIIEQ